MVDLASKIFQAVLCPTQLFNENRFALSTKPVLATKFQGEKASRDMTSSRNPVSTIGA